ncbi:MAG: hypothetical protein O7C75_11390 [Verrucomicrobia bacterium]|nr:hypothetical protein [Verrucomicrobiota bacterium]
MKMVTLFNRILIISITTSATVLSISAEEKDIPLTEVPEAVLKTAKAEVPGIKLLEAEVEEENGVTVYELEGVKEGFEYELEISKDGKLLELTKERKKENE